jgi:hypothetical protein
MLMLPVPVMSLEFKSKSAPNPELAAIVPLILMLPVPLIV